MSRANSRRYRLIEPLPCYLDAPLGPVPALWPTAVHIRSQRGREAVSKEVMRMELGHAATDAARTRDTKGQHDGGVRGPVFRPLVDRLQERKQHRLDIEAIEAAIGAVAAFVG